MDEHELELEKLRAIQEMRSQGEMFAQLEPHRKYVLVLYELYPNGSTSNSPIEDPKVVKEVGKRTGLGDPTDYLGFGIWEVPDAAK